MTGGEVAWKRQDVRWMIDQKILVVFQGKKALLFGDYEGKMMIDNRLLPGEGFGIGVGPLRFPMMLRWLSVTWDSKVKSSHHMIDFSFVTGRLVDGRDLATICIYRYL